MERSYFDGKLLGLIGLNILVWVITIITLGLAYPWVIVLKLRWMTKHTVIEGRRLRFDGTGSGLFGNYVIWLVFTFITLGLYGFWLSIAMKEWSVKHTHFA